MHRRRLRRLIAALLLACAPLTAFASEAVLSRWGAYSFFAIVATVVIVLLLHEVLDHDEENRTRDERRTDAFHAHEPSNRQSARRRVG